MTVKNFFRRAFLLCLLLSALIVPARAANGFFLAVNPYGGSRDSVDTIRCELSSVTERDGTKRYMLYLPADCDSTKLVVYYGGVKNLRVDGVSVVSGEPTDCFSQVNREYSLQMDGFSYPLLVLQSENLPAVYLSTESGSLSALHSHTGEYTEQGQLRLHENGEQTADAPMKSIKLRGNWTRKHAKKPYTITLYDKVSLCGMEKAKKWVLVANWLEYTLLRNSLAQRMAKAFDLAYGPDFRMVDLYINGEYRGNYQLFEKIEIGQNRIAVPDLKRANKQANLGIDLKERKWVNVLSADYIKTGYRRWVDVPNEPENITGAYLLELEISTRTDDAPSMFVTDNGQTVVVKSPKYASKGEVDYIGGLFSDAHAALLAQDGYNSKGKHYSEYFDLDSLARMYILQEYTMNIDASLTSAYFLKLPDDDKLYAVAPWDFDHSLFAETTGHRFGIDLSQPYGWFAAIGSIPRNAGVMDKPTPTLLQSAMRHEEFRDMVAELWEELAPLTEELIEEELPRMAEENKVSAVMDAYRWGYSYKSCEEDKAYTKQGSIYLQAEEYQEQTAAYLQVVEHLRDKCRIRVGELNVGLAKDAALVFFVGRNGESYTVIEPMLPIGASMPVPGYIGTPKTYRWNTRPNWSGTFYNYKDNMPLTQRTTILYPS